MRIIIDANILIAALIKDGTIRRICMEKGIYLYSPAFILEEILGHAEELEHKTGLSNAALRKTLDDLTALSDITIVSPVEIKPFLQEARDICPDPYDVEYVALALKMRCPIWSEDKELKATRKVNVINTKELIMMFGSDGNYPRRKSFSHSFKGFGKLIRKTQEKS